MKRILFLLPLTALLLAACAPSTIVTSVAPLDTMAPVTVNPNTPAAMPTNSGAQAATLAAPPAAQQPNTGSIPLQVKTPLDGAVVNTAQLSVQGTSSPGAVVTVNDQILIAGADGTFTATVTLDQGPNLIEILASDVSGNQASLELAVTYQP